MEFSYPFTYQVCLDAYTALYWRPFRKIGVGVVTSAALFEAYMLIESVRDAMAEGASLRTALTGNSNPLMLFAIAVSALIVAFAVTYPRRRARRLYSTSPARDGLVHVSITPDSFDAKVEAGASSSLAWSFYEKWRETKRVVVLVAKGGQFQFLPKSVLTGEQLAELRNLLGSKLPRK